LFVSYVLFMPGIIMIHDNSMHTLNTVMSILIYKIFNEE